MNRWSTTTRTAWQRPSEGRHGIRLPLESPLVYNRRPMRLTEPRHRRQAGSLACLEALPGGQGRPQGSGLPTSLGLTALLARPVPISRPRPHEWRAPQPPSPIDGMDAISRPLREADAGSEPSPDPTGGGTAVSFNMDYTKSG